MIKINKDIQLQSIKITDYKQLYDLMTEIYPPVYNYLWTDGGKQYLSQIYSFENFQKELNESDAAYYFVQHQLQTIGILKIRKKVSQQTIQLHRIYLHQNYQGKGIGKNLFQWVENSFAPSYKILTLEVMKSETKAISFYEKMGMKFKDISELNFKNIKPAYKHILTYQKHL